MTRRTAATAAAVPVAVSKWIVRIVVVLLLWPAIGILWFGRDGWDSRLGGTTNNAEALTDREASIARTGVLLEHATQLFLWLLVLAVNEMAETNNKLRHIAIATTILWLLYVGVYGLSAFFIVGCRSYGLCLEEGRQFQFMSSVLIIILLVALALSCCGSTMTAGGATNHAAAGYEPIVNGGGAAGYSTSTDSLKSAAADEEQTTITTTAATSNSSSESATLLLNEALRQAKSESKDKDKLITKLGKKLKSLLAENEGLRSR
jgi:hypothetical protein